MPFKKGESGNPSGRKKGVDNKIGAEVKELISDFLETDYTKFTAEMGKLEGKDYVTAYLKLLEYELPKKRQQEDVIDFSNLTEEQAAKVVERLAEQLRQNDQ